jgi:putative ABC transport system permease protein
VLVAGITVVVVTAAVAFAASLDALGDEPGDFGVTWDVSVGEAGSSEQSVALEDGLRRDGGVAALSGITGEGLTVGDGGAEVAAMVLFGDEVEPRVVGGRAPRGPDEIAFAGQTLEDLGVVVGDRVPVGIDGTRPLLVTGEVVLNGAGLLDDLENGEGALLPDPAQQLLVPPEDREQSFPSTYLVRLQPGVDREAVVARLERENPRTVVGPVTPSQVDNIERVAGLPALLAAFVAVLGTGTIVHATVTTVRRRRRDLAMLAGLGFLRRQVAATLAWQATAVAVVALVVGLPLGVALGRWSWRLTSDALWVVSTPRVPVLALVLVAVAALVVVNAAALGAGALVRRGSPSVALRAE